MSKEEEMRIDLVRRDQLVLMPPMCKQRDVYLSSQAASASMRVFPPPDVIALLNNVIVLVFMIPSFYLSVRVFLLLSCLPLISFLSSL